MKKLHDLIIPGVLSVLLTGCQAASSALKLTEETAATIPVNMAPLTNPLESNFQLQSGQPVLEQSEAWESTTVEPGATLFHAGQFHLFYNAMRNVDNPAVVGYAWSEDGRVWVKPGTEPVLTIADIPWEPKPATLRANSILVQDGVWVLYFSASPSTGSFIGKVGRATAPAPAGPWTVDPEPVLLPGPSGEWDTFAVGGVDVERTESGYVMYYSCGGGIGMATSPDGVAWTKYNDPATSEKRLAGSDPVIPGFMEDPSVVRMPWGWAMVYLEPMKGLNYAYSADGIRWTDNPANPIVMAEGQIVWYSDLAVVDDTAYLYVGMGDPLIIKIFLATWSVK